MIKTIRRLYYRIFKCYLVTDRVLVPYADADRLLKLNEGQPEAFRWQIAPEEDHNKIPGYVHLQKRVRITH